MTIKRISILALCLYFLSCLAFVVYQKFNGLYGQDAHEYYRYSKALLNWFLTKENPGDYFWPVWYPLSGAVLSFVTKIPLLFSLQLVSITSIVIVLAAVIYWEGENNITPQRIYYTFLIVGLAPFLLRSGIVIMADTLSIATCMLALWCFKQQIELKAEKWALGFAFFGAVSVMTRYASAVVLLPAFILCFYTLLENKQWHTIVLGGVIALSMCIPHIYIRSGAPLNFINHAWVSNWSFLNYFKTHFITKDGSAFYKLPNVLYALETLFHPGFGIVFFFLLPFVRREDFNTTFRKALLASILLYSLFLAGVPFQNKRFLLASFPLMAIWFFPSYTRAIQYFKTKWILPFIGVIHLCLFAYYFHEVDERNKLEKQLAASLSSQPEKIVYTFDVDVAIKSYINNKEFRNLWVSRYDTFAIGSLVLFNENKLGEQWKDKNPMLNWKDLNDNYSLVPIKRDASGWELLKIENRK